MGVEHPACDDGGDDIVPIDCAKMCIVPCVTCPVYIRAVILHTPVLPTQLPRPVRQQQEGFPSIRDFENVSALSAGLDLT